MSIKDEPPLDIPRDQWQRPKILQLDSAGNIIQVPVKKRGKIVPGEWAPDMPGYVRISGLAKELDTTFGISKWQAAMTAIGVTMDEDIHAQLRRLVHSSDDPYNAHKSKIIALAVQAQEAAGSTVKRDLGTELHYWCQWVDKGGQLAEVPADLQDDVLAYCFRTSELDKHAVEVFGVLDDIRAAGSLDGIVTLPDPSGLDVVADIKTGQREPQHPMSVEMQVACYSRMQRYDPVTGARSPLFERPISTEHGLLIHLPSGSGTCELYPLDLTRGWDNVQEALAVKQCRKRSGRRLQPITEWSASA